MRRLPMLACLLPALAAAAPALELPPDLPQAPGRSVPPNVLLALSLTWHDARAAHLGPYDAQAEYAGYFNPRLCYRYPARAAAHAYFTPAGPADASHECTRAFSGNFLNWAATSRLDLLRLALTGGDRVLDTPGTTVLQRATLPGGAPNVDFYAHPAWFPRRTIANGAGVTPFGEGLVHVVSCGERILFSRTATGSGCGAPRRGGSGRLLASDKRLGEYAARVEVCDEDDAAGRPWLCQPRGAGAKPEGVLQQLAGSARFGVMGYLTGTGVEDRNAYGAVLRSPIKSLAPETLDGSGVLAADPDRGGTGQGGTINYINRLGRDGVYKNWAPTAELYYEALRYLQGRPPTVAGPREDAGFATWDSRPDPVLASCQRHAIALLAHAHADEDRYVPGNTVVSHLDRARAVDAFGPGAPLDAMAWTARAGQAVGVAGLALQGEGPGGTGSTYLAGLALRAGSQPLRDGSDAVVDTLAVQLDAAGNGRTGALELAARQAGSAGAFRQAGAARDIVPVVRALLTQAVRPRGAIAAGAVAHRNADGAAYVLRTSYERADWSGDMERIDVAPDGKLARTAWRASARLPAHRERRIFTTVLRGGASATVPFTHAGLPPGLLSEQEVDYLRGDRSREGAGLRPRSGTLGAIVRSEPLLVGPAPAAAGPITGAPGRARPGVAYAAANDGMLHGFDIESGAERFAYVPRRLLPGLGELAREGYRQRAHFDASPGAGQVQAGAGRRTVLASGYGMGAKGLFAIDASDPDDFGAGAGELWQFTEADDALVGHIHARPAIARFRVGGTAAAPAYRDFAVVSSGINNYADDAAPHGALFLLSLDKRGPGPWKRGADYFRLLAPAALADQANALGPPALVRDRDGAVRRAYAGDLQGNLWRFDFSAGPPWPAAGTLLFAARAGRSPQPVTAAPAVVHAPGGYLVLFGTGRLVEAADLEAQASAVQSFYAVLDAPGGTVPVKRDSLVERRLESRDGLPTVTGPDIDYAEHKGWFLDFPDSSTTGERVVATPPVGAGIVIVRSLLPPDDPCAGPPSRTYVLDALTGLSAGPAHTITAEPSPRTARKASAFPPPLVMSWAAGRTGDAGGARPAVRFSFIALDGSAPPAPVTVAAPARRLSWREIPNWEELHDASR